jgi:hypothetical protein
MSHLPWSQGTLGGSHRQPSIETSTDITYTNPPTLRKKTQNIVDKELLNLQCKLCYSWPKDEYFNLKSAFWLSTCMYIFHNYETTELMFIVILPVFILQSLLNVLRESHRTRNVFRKVGGFVYVMSVLVSHF